MTAFRKVSCNRRGCTYWRVKLDSPEHGRRCPKCGATVNRDTSYTIQWIEGGSKRTETLATRNKREAEKVLREREAAAASSCNSRPSSSAPAPRLLTVVASTMGTSPPFDEVADAYSANRIGAIKSYEREQVSIRHLKKHFGNKPIGDIQEEDINNYRNTRTRQTVIHDMPQTRKDGTPFVRNKNPRFVKKSTVGRELSVLKLIFAYALRKEYVSYSAETHPMKGVKIDVSRKINHPVTDEKLHTLFKRCHYNLAHLFEFIYETGCRPIEAMTLRWVDILPGQPMALLMDTKTSDAEGSTEELHLSPRALEIISFQPQICEYVFANPKTRDRWKNINKAFRNAAIAANLVYADGPLRPHDLRHAFLRKAALAGVNTPTLLAMSRHSDTRSLLRYTKKADGKAVQQAFVTIEGRKKDGSAT